MKREDKIRLNLGCRNDILDGFINIDIDDIQIGNSNFKRMNVLDIDLYFKVNSVIEIVANHLFEHLTHSQISVLLYKIWKILKPNGILRITVPDFQQLIFQYDKRFRNNDYGSLDTFQSRIFGIEEESLHKTFWNPHIGLFYLQREGFFSDITINRDEQECTLIFMARKKI